VEGDSATVDYVATGSFRGYYCQLEPKHICLCRGIAIRYENGKYRDSASYTKYI